MKATCGECGETFSGPFEEAEAALREHIETEHLGEEAEDDG